jgi:hypothetical protein
MRKPTAFPSRLRIISTLAFLLGAAPEIEHAQVAADRAVVGANVKNYANAVLAVMSYTAVPDVTTSSLSINSGASGNRGFGQTPLGGGFTLGRSFPLYLEGTVAYSRYNPTFLASDGGQERPVPAKWNTVSTTIGVGWDSVLPTSSQSGRFSTACWAGPQAIYASRKRCSITPPIPISGSSKTARLTRMVSADR